MGVVSVGGLNECRAVHGPYTERNGRSRTTSHFRKRTEKKRKTKEGGGGEEKEMKEENKRNLGTTSSKVGVEGYAD